MNPTETFGSMVFNDKVFRERLKKEDYEEYVRCVEEDKPLTLRLATVIAEAMKTWAIEQGCTHFTHWFQPLTGVTAEKHDSFIESDGKGGVIMKFSGKELIKGEPDASSFPSGGLRATFEARGYTAWDPTSYAFIKDGVLCVPTAFCSYNGQALDKKTPLLRSMEELNRQAVKILHIFGKTDVKKVIPMAGPEQEYFLIDRSMCEKRPDLVFCGRTLFGARAPKGQELGDHYFGAVKPRVVAYMKELDEELWKLGVYAKTKHNETAPSQHELAVIYTDVNTATDHNQIVMEMMKKIATRHGFTCLLHEKPFASINGSGKHNNWSLQTDTGINLLEPGENPHDNMLFLLILSTFISAVDKHQDLLRISCASAGNDLRLGAYEAPPAVISIFLGDELTGILSAIEKGKNFSERANCEIEIGVKGLPKFRKDSTDRNRTSPLAFTGNKFEFRLTGSAFSVADTNLIMNTIFADELAEVEKKLDPDNLAESVIAIVRDVMREHKRIIFNGNGYSGDWIKEAERLGLLNLPTTVDALPYFAKEENVSMFERHGILSRTEIESRTEIQMENYCNILHIECLTMTDMTRELYLPAIRKYIRDLSDTAFLFKENKTLDKLIKLYEQTEKNVAALEKVVEKTLSLSLSEKAIVYRDDILPAMKKLRASVDEAELMTAKKYWPVPSYADLLFSAY